MFPFLYIKWCKFQRKHLLSIFLAASSFPVFGGILLARQLIDCICWQKTLRILLKCKRKMKQMRQINFYLNFCMFPFLYLSTKLISSIAGTKQIPLWVHLNFSPLYGTSSQRPKPNHARITRVFWLCSLTIVP